MSKSASDRQRTANMGRGTRSAGMNGSRRSNPPRNPNNSRNQASGGGSHLEYLLSQGAQDHPAASVPAETYFSFRTLSFQTRRPPSLSRRTAATSRRGAPQHTNYSRQERRTITDVLHHVRAGENTAAASSSSSLSPSSPSPSPAANGMNNKSPSSYPRSSKVIRSDDAAALQNYRRQLAQRREERRRECEREYNYEDYYWEWSGSHHAPLAMEDDDEDNAAGGQGAVLEADERSYDTAYDDDEMEQLYEGGEGGDGDDNDDEDDEDDSNKGLLFPHLKAVEGPYTMKRSASRGGDMPGYGATTSSDVAVYAISMDDDTHERWRLPRTISMTKFYQQVREEQLQRKQQEQQRALEDGTEHTVASSDVEEGGAMDRATSSVSLRSADGTIHFDAIDKSLRRRYLRDPNEYTVPVDPTKNYRGSSLNVCSFSRPHMRAFHGSWIGFFAGYLLWFSFAPLLPKVRQSLDLTVEQVWSTNIWSVGSCVFIRLALGPLCDKYGARSMMSLLLVGCAIPCILSGLVQNLTHLAIARAFIGLVGGTFVAGQCWTASNFTPEIGGTALATAAGWGGMGGGITQVLMGSVIYPMCVFLTGGNEDLAWRISFLFPSAVALYVAYFFYYYADDCPLGNYTHLKKLGLMTETNAWTAFVRGAQNLNAWILFFQFGATLGVELTMDNMAATYYHQQFGLDISSAAAFASLFGLTNLVARGLGGFISDVMNRYYSLWGRLLAHMCLMLVEGCCIIAFGLSTSLAWTVSIMLLFSCFVQMSMGSLFGCVPYVDPPNTGTIAGIVGAGGNVGAMVISSVFKSHSYVDGFLFMGAYAILSALCTPLIVIPGHYNLLWDRTPPPKQKVLSMAHDSP